jgi:phosphate starvation-inducible PhoH-like protein|tara:strand:+ start:129 stop:791 length:663 start_codon:yes stop_codon:yes gene_type:complete
MPENTNKRVPKGAVKYNITLSEEQKLAKAEIRNHPFNFILGKAGSGKTLLAVQIALDCFFKREVNKIVITRPTISNEDNGFLPGSLDEKMEPWLVPIRSNMRKVYNKPIILEKMEKNEDIELVSLSHFRGRTFDSSIVIVDEFQNLNKQQLAMVLGRLGKNSRMMLCGDPQQIDLKFTNDSAVHEVHKLRDSEFVYSVNLKDNHRHESLDDVLRLLFSFE